MVMLGERIAVPIQRLGESSSSAESGQEKTSGRPTGELWPALALQVAAQGTRGSAESLPHSAAVQESFGHHDISGGRRTWGTTRRKASARLGADAFAFRDHVAFGGTPDLRTTAHEAAHVVQQRAGVALRDGIGERGDVYERHADEVADKVARGEPAEALLDRMVAPDRAGGAQSAVQRAVTTEEISKTTDTGNTYKQSLKVDTTANTILLFLGVKFVKADTWANDAAFTAFNNTVKAAVNTYHEQHSLRSSPRQRRPTPGPRSTCRSRSRSWTTRAATPSTATAASTAAAR